MFQSTPSAKTEWRQENGYSQQKESHNEKPPIAMLTTPPIHARTTTTSADPSPPLRHTASDAASDCAPKRQARHLLGG